jgi:nucleotide-binding universal stress UspA family protein
MLLVAVLLGLGLLFAVYSGFLSTLTSEGGMNAWLARAVAALLTAGVVFGLVTLCSQDKERQMTGLGTVVGCIVAFYLVMYAWTKPAESQRKQRLEAERQELARSEEQNRQQLARSEQERNRREQEKRQFGERYVKDLASVAPTDMPNAIALVIKAEGPGAETDALRGRLVEAIQRQGKLAVDVFKPAFCQDSLFDDLWKGDRSVLRRLRLSDQGPGGFLLAKLTVSQPERTDVRDVLSVQGSVSFLLMTKDAAKGPVVFKAPGVGFDASSAGADCCRRILETMKPENVFAQ